MLILSRLIILSHVEFMGETVSRILVFAKKVSNVAIAKKKVGQKDRLFLMARTISTILSKARFSRTTHQPKPGLLKPTVFVTSVTLAVCTCPSSTAKKELRSASSFLL